MFIATYIFKDANVVNDIEPNCLLDLANFWQNIQMSSKTINEEMRDLYFVLRQESFKTCESKINIHPEIDR